MKLDLHFDIAHRLTLLLVLLAIVLPAAVGAFFAHNSYLTLRAAVVSELLATAIEKQAALDIWINERQADLAALAAAPHVRDDLASRSAAPASPDGAAASAGLGQAVHDHLIADLQGWTGPNRAFLALAVIEPEHGQVIASTDPGEEGKYREDRAYFISGKAGPTVQNPQYTAQGWAMFVAAPLRSADGRLLGVLAGRVNLAEMNAIIARHTGLRQTADAYLVNTSNLLVTQPRFIADPIVLQRGIYTEAAKLCLARNSGVISADDYRGVPTISVYRWLPKTELCLIAEMDQAEAFIPLRALGMTNFRIAGLALLATLASAIVLTRSITRPVRQLVQGTQEIGKGNLEYRITVRTTDEFGQLANAFNEMATNLRTSLGETTRGQRLLAALSQAAQAIQRAHTPEEVYRTVGDEVARLGYHAAFFALTDDGTHLSLPYLNFDPALQQTAERLVGVTAADFRLSLTPDGFYQRTLAGGETVFLDPFLEPITEAVPWLLRPLIGQVTKLLDIKQGIVAPLKISGEVRSLLMVTGDGLNSDDVLAVKTFANQTAIALENARLYQETRAWAAELEQRVQAQTEIIRATEERLRTVVTHAPIVLWASDRAGTFTLSEGKGLEPQGLKPGELIGRSVFEVYRDVPRILEDSRRALNGEAFTSTVEVSGLIFDTHYSPVRDPNGQVIGVTAVSIDITERKRAEEQLARTAADLARSNTELERFAYVASHDLQEPLRMVTSYLQLIERRYGDRLDGDAREFMGYAVDGANRMKALINDLLAYSRVGMRGKPFGPVDCETILAQATANLQITIEENAAIVTHDLLPAVTGDDVQLTQLLQNLIGNAIKFRRAEPPRVHISAALRMADSRWQMADNQPPSAISHQPSAEWVFSVSDNGIGIDPQYFDRIFVIFQRLHTRDDYHGTGIGLAISKRIVERHGGRIWVESQPGQGTIFYFTIPA